MLPNPRQARLSQRAHMHAVVLRWHLFTTVGQWCVRGVAVCVADVTRRLGRWVHLGPPSIRHGKSHAAAHWKSFFHVHPQYWYATLSGYSSAAALSLFMFVGTNILYLYGCCALRSVSSVNLNKMAWIGSRRRIIQTVFPRTKTSSVWKRLLWEKIHSACCCGFLLLLFHRGFQLCRNNPTVWHRTCAYTLLNECGHTRPRATFGCGLSDGIANATSTRLDHTCA